MEFGDNSGSSQSFCNRCKKLDLLDWLRQDIPIKGDMDLTRRRLGINDLQVFRKLGRVGSIVLRNNCGLCRCLFGLTPSPMSCDQEVILVLSWSLYRLEGSIHMDSVEKRTASKHVSAMLHPSELFTIADLSSTRGDGLCIVEENPSHSKTTLSARNVDPNQVDLRTVKMWLSDCERLHPLTCTPSRSEKLENISLIDVNSRQITLYPSQQCDYLALSYVWGGIEQIIPNAGRPGTALAELPRTVEDAITFVKMLGKQYLWVDSVCIDQKNADEKLQQIRIMSEIYRGAYATIVALSSATANAGLPRVASGKNEYHQLSCTIDGTRLVGLGPTLSQLVWVLPWGDRAWTFQEALLSQRCIYMTNYQAYFECNSMQCCESLDVSRSWVHQSVRDEALLKGAPEVPTFGTGVLRSPFIPESSPYDGRLDKYSTLVTLYKYRSLTKHSDAINGFSAILQALEQSEYSDGFFWGLPIADLNWALLWEGRRGSPQRQKDFPTWSWANWRGAIWPGKPQGDQRDNPHRHSPDLRMWKKSQRELEKTFETSYLDVDPEDLQDPDDPLSKEIKLKETNCLQTLANLMGPESRRMLCIESVILHFKPDLSDPEEEDFDPDGHKYFTMYVRDVPLLLRIVRTNELLRRSYQGQKRMFALLARDIVDEGWVEHFLLLLRPVRDFFERCGVVRLSVQQTRLRILEELGLTKTRVLLV